MIVLHRPIKFAENLKYYRTKHGFTQKQLAERIGYTEKSISKWERGNALPTMDMFLKIADLFKVSLDELMFEKTSFCYFLGIDGGGTKTVFKLVDGNGTVVSEITKGSSNPNDIGMQAAQNLLKEGISEACYGIPYSKITLFAGLAGGGLTYDNSKVLNQFFSKFGFAAFDNGSDMENLVMLADCKRCVIVIMGTGFIVYAIDGDKKHRISGWGQFFDDGGSGYTIARDAITAALCAGDGSGEATLLCELFEKRLGESVEAHISKFYQGSKRYIAAFADLVFAAAKAGDRVACEILDKNMKFVAGKIDTAADRIGKSGNDVKIPVFFSGGISLKKDMLFGPIEKHLKNEGLTLKLIENKPVDGAIKYAQKLYAERER